MLNKVQSLLKPSATFLFDVRLCTILSREKTQVQFVYTKYGKLKMKLTVLVYTDWVTPSTPYIVQL